MKKIKNINIKKNIKKDIYKKNILKLILKERMSTIPLKKNKHIILFLSPPQAKSWHGEVRCSRSAHLIQPCCDFFNNRAMSGNLFKNQMKYLEFLIQEALKNDLKRLFLCRRKSNIVTVKDGMIGDQTRNSVKVQVMNYNFHFPKLENIW